ncbi:sigma-70 family RNA polymerase sigma factor [Actinomadura sp. NPDC048021]|uniref:RNA polymerase sigma factor n=1 Tax=Actinomadura sp. NPDC048021 TaxID=3155385 RepID=UPI0033F38247
MLRRNWRGQEVVDENAVFRHVLDVADKAARGLGLTAHQAEDIASTVAESLCKRSGTLMQIVKEGRDPKAYVRRTARNECVNYFQRKEHDRRVHDSLVHSLNALKDAAGKVPDTSTRVADKVTLQQAMGGLPRELLVIVIMKFYEDMPLSGISAELGVPHGTVKSRYLRALRQLREAIQGDGPHAEVE